MTAADAHDRAGQLMALTRRLAELLAAETRAYEARRPHDAARLAGETGELATLYRLESLRLQREPHLLAGLTSEQRAELIAATERFEATLARHGAALTAAKTVTEGLVQAIAAEVAQSRAPAAGYGAFGRPGAGDARAIALNARA